ncbi:triosephosphate isomerase, partial [Candidatus Uhrbacteria bacterium]|nr:triosephosphate isomerase [Candidatus Uhrbacteria bacterium]
MKPLLVANWKMQLRDADAIAIASEVAGSPIANVELVLCPSFTVLSRVAEAVRGSAIALGAQDGALDARGALTGEVSPEDLRTLGCQYALVGHSERRQRLGETDAMIGKKFRATIAAGLCPILCVGESFEERAEGKREAVLT